MVPIRRNTPVRRRFMNDQTGEHIDYWMNTAIPESIPVLLANMTDPANLYTSLIVAGHEPSLHVLSLLRPRATFFGHEGTSYSTDHPQMEGLFGFLSERTPEEVSERFSRFVLWGSVTETYFRWEDFVQRVNERRVSAAAPEETTAMTRDTNT